jgi:hypothetical protein
MCEVDFDGEYWKAHKIELRKARKEYKCQACGRQIAKGEKYAYESGIGHDSYPFWGRACERCHDAIDDYFKRHHFRTDIVGMPERLDECLDAEPESAEWIGKYYALKPDPDDVPGPDDDPEDFPAKPPLYIVYEAPKPA